MNASYQKDKHMGIIVYRLYPKGKEMLKIDFDYPKMVAPFNKQEMINFFLREVKKMEGEIFK